MKLYDFSLFKRRRDAARAVVESVSKINQPGSVIELKQKVETFLELHREATRKRA